MDNKIVNSQENMELSDDMLETVSGGAGKRQMMNIACGCGNINNVDVTKTSFVCSNCGKRTLLRG